jgi:hypothetical protein
MEQSCYKCGQLVEEGIAFCPHCSAPQIRVIIAEPPAALAIAGDAPRSAAGAAGFRSADLRSDDLPASETLPVLAVPMRWSDAAQPCALAALIASIAMVLKLIAPIMAAPGAGFLAVAFYRRRHPEVALRAATGARLGALCGLFCSGITTVLATFRIAVLHEGSEIRNDLLEGIRQSAAHYSDPQFQSTLDFLRSPTGLMIMLVLLLVFAFLLLLLLATLGGACGGALFKRRDRS